MVEAHKLMQMVETHKYLEMFETHNFFSNDRNKRIHSNGQNSKVILNVRKWENWLIFSIIWIKIASSIIRKKICVSTIW